MCEKTNTETRAGARKNKLNAGTANKMGKKLRACQHYQRDFSSTSWTMAVIYTKRRETGKYRKRRAHAREALIALVIVKYVIEASFSRRTRPVPRRVCRSVIYTAVPCIYPCDASARENRWKPYLLTAFHSPDRFL